MYNFDDHLIVLKSAITDQNFEIQTQIISQLVNCIQQSNDNERTIEDILKTNLVPALNDVISSQLSILMPTLKLIRYLMIDFHFRNYEFLSILKNILRVLILCVQCDRIEKSQLEFFDVVDSLDVLLKMYLWKDSSKRKEADLQAVFVCLLKFIELVNCDKCLAVAIKTLMMEIYLHLLNLIEIHNCISKNFELTMKVSNLADVFLDYLLEKYRKDARELWLFKIIEILFRLLESNNHSNILQVKCFENIFYGRMSFVLEQIMILNSSNSNSELFKFCISILNTILWTPSFSKNFCNKILKKIVKLKADSIIFDLSKSTRKIRKYTQYSMKIFLISFLVHSDGSSSRNNHCLLGTFLQARLPNSIVDLRPSEIVKNKKVLIQLYECSLFKQQLRNSLNANKVLENLAIILRNPESDIDDDDICKILRIFAYFSNYAFLSELEYTGVQKISETLLTKITESLFVNQRFLYPIDKYILSFVEEFSTNTKITNTLILAYISQEPSLTSSKIGQILSSSQILPFICSTDYNQVVNAVTILQRKHLKEEDMDYIAKQCFCHLKSDEIIIEGALTLIDKNSRIVSARCVKEIFTVTAAFLEAKRKTVKYSAQCYYLMMQTCVNLVRCASNVDLKFEEFPQ